MEEINRYIDHTLLKANATKQQIQDLCAEAKKYNFATVCLNPTWVELAARELKGTDTGVCTVIGFPLGASQTPVKAFETAEAIRLGATEVDMVLNIGALLDGNLALVEEDIREVVRAAGTTTVKVIFETCLLSNEQIKTACELSEKAGAKFVKTSTGFSTDGATLAHVELMKSSITDKVQVKASGGIRDLTTALSMIKAGATRLGTSSGVKLMNGETGSGY